MSWKPREERVSRRRGWTSVLNAAVKTRTGPSTLDLTLTGAISRYSGDKIQLKLRRES